MPALSRLALVGVLAILTAGCSPRFAQPYRIEAPRVAGPRSVVASGLTSLPPPTEPVVVAVYRFRDQTGQYRALENTSTFSTAVTQGATSILVRALQESGWFTPIEREGLSNLLNERQIIQTTRQQYTGPDGEALAPLPPLLYAGVILEGGIIGYDSNLITGGAGVRYFGTGVSGQFRQDQVTIYLRAVSTQNGRVLRTVYTTKTIVSQKLDTGVFRYVDLRRLLETEAGYSTNEPPVLAVTAAIEEAVRSLVVEGAREGLWTVANPQSPEALAMFTDYDARVQEDARRDAFDRLTEPAQRDGLSVEVSGGAARIQSDYASPSTLPVAGAALRYGVGRGVGLGVSFRAGQLDAGAENRLFLAGDAHVRGALLPSARVTPYVTLGLGFISVPDNQLLQGNFIQGFGGAGVDIYLTHHVNSFLEASTTYPFREGLDGTRGGNSIHDNLFSIKAGLIYSIR
jgi:curli production assembly/transport component CsgG